MTDPSAPTALARDPGSNEARLLEGYYLANFLTVLEEVQGRYGDLLTGEELDLIRRFHVCSLGAQRLYVRMLTRKGPWFRRDGLAYREIGDPDPLSEELIREGFCEAQASLDDLLPLLTREDLVELLGSLAIPRPRGSRREALLDRLLQGSDEAHLLECLKGRLRPLKPLWGDLWKRVFLMFFGNFEQDLSSFVVTDLGHARYEPYLIDPRTRAFEARRDVDFLLSVRELRERLESKPDDLSEITQRVLAMETHQGVRQQRRFQGLLNNLGHAWERAKDLDRALACYALSERPPARERRTRITAARGDLEAACRMAMALVEAPQDVGEARFARTFLGRLRKKVPAAAQWVQTHPKPQKPPEVCLTVAKHPFGSVEKAVLESERLKGWEGFFAENHLWRALFGLAFWEEIFADVPGAFQHRFQNAPLDIGTAAFFEKRQDRIEGRLAELRSHPNLGGCLLDVADSKWGTANAFIGWRHLDRSSLAEALARIDGNLLIEILRIMARNPMAFDNGFPDLFLYLPDSRTWKLLEVKGPGDSLRPEQEWWLAHFNRLGGCAQVGWVSFLGEPGRFGLGDP